MSSNMPENGNHFLISLIFLAFGKFIDLIAAVQPIMAHYQVPLVIMQAFMIVAYCGTGIAGIVAGYKFWDEKIKDKLKKRRVKR